MDQTRGSRATPEIDTEGLRKLLELFNLSGSKREIRKLCRDLAITSRDLFHFILAGRGGALDGYQYEPYFLHYVPESLDLTDENLRAMRSNGVGPLSADAKKAFNKVMQTFTDRRMFAAHLFYTGDKKFWHLIYFDQRDNQEEDNHWTVGGPHVHYSRESFCRQPLPVVWDQICQNPPQLPPSIHVRCRESA